MSTSKLVVDHSVHTDIGMTVVSGETVRERCPPASEEWPEDELFDPPGITLAEVCNAMIKCS